MTYSKAAPIVIAVNKRTLAGLRRQRRLAGLPPCPHLQLIVWSLRTFAIGG